MMCTVCGCVSLERRHLFHTCDVPVALHVYRQPYLSYIYARGVTVGRTLNFNIGPLMRNRSKRRRMSNQQSKAALSIAVPPTDPGTHPQFRATAAWVWDLPCGACLGGWGVACETSAPAHFMRNQVCRIAGQYNEVLESFRSFGGSLGGGVRGLLVTRSHLHTSD